MHLRSKTAGKPYFLSSQTSFQDLSILLFGEEPVSSCVGVELGNAEGGDEGSVEGLRETVGSCDGVEMGINDTEGCDEGLIEDVGKPVSSCVGTELGKTAFPVAL